MHCEIVTKILHFTDPHLVAPGETLFGLDPAARLAGALAHAQATHPDAAAICLTGDLTDSGTVAAYEALKELLADVTIPVHLTLGNHDNRAAFVRVFGCDHLDEYGFVQTTFDAGGYRIVVVDSHDATSVHGSLDGGRLDWLAAQLTGADGRPVIVAMHHPPTHLHVPNFAAFGLLEPERLLAVLSRQGNVRHMLFGHMHLPVSGSLWGIPFSVSQSTCQHIALDLHQSGKPDFVAAHPSYDVVLLTDKTVTVHPYAGYDTLSPVRPGDPK